MLILVILKKVFLVGAVSAAIFLAISIGLIFSQSPKLLTGGDTLEFDKLRQGRESVDAPLMDYLASNGDTLRYRRFDAGNDSAPLMVLVHGSGWHGEAYQTLAKKIAASGAASVVVPDLRGHGPSPLRRGDIDYIGQLEDDLAKLIQHTKMQGQQVVLAGHSSGGGLAVRFSGGEHRTMVDGAVLIAPFLKYDAPTMRPNSGGWAHTLVRRTIGISMLNAVKITWLNHLTSIQFLFPKAVLDSAEGKTATSSYSYRLNTSYAPRSDYLADVAKLPNFLLLVGEEDEAFKASEFQPTLSAATDKGRYAILPKLSHLDIINSDLTVQSVSAFLADR